MRKGIKYSIALALSILLIGCGSSDDQEPLKTPTSATGQNSLTLVGIIIDSPIEGLSYKTESKAGITNAKGEFSYLFGEQITFSIGDINFPVILAASKISPLDMAKTQDINNQTVTNIIRFMQTLDSDSNPENGISISSAVSIAATGFSIDFLKIDDASFEAETSSFLNTVKPDSPTLISTAEATQHFKKTIDTSTAEGSSAVTVKNKELLIKNELAFGETIDNRKIFVRADAKNFPALKSTSQITLKMKTLAAVQTGNGQIKSRVKIIFQPEEFIGVSELNEFGIEFINRFKGDSRGVYTDAE